MFRRSPRLSQASARPRRVRTKWFGSVEGLEGRSLLTTFTWSHAVSGSFGDPTMWVDSQNHQGVPGPGDAAVTPSGSYTITSTGSTTVGRFAGGAGSELEVKSGTLTVTNSAGASSNVSILAVDAGAAFHAAGGATAVNNGIITGDVDAAAGSTIAFNGTSFLFAGTTLTGAGTFDVAASFDIKAATTAPKLLVVTQTGSITVEGSATLTVPSGATMDWQGGLIGGSVVVAHGGSLTIEGPSLKTLNFGVLSIAGNASWAGAGNLNIFGGAALVNQQGGLFNVMNNAQIGFGSNGSFTNSGTLEKFGSTGTTTITVPLTNTGLIRLDSQAILNASNGFTQAASGSLVTVVAGVPANGQSGQLQVGGVAHLAGTLGVSLGSVAGGGQFLPTVGQDFPVVTYGSASGGFSNVNVPSINTRSSFSTSVKPTGIDLVALSTTPPAPTGLTLLAADDKNGPGATVLTQPRLTGTALPGLLVQVYDQNIRLIASAIAGPDGTFIATPSTALAVGNYTLSAVAIDSANRYGSNGNPYSLTIVARPLAPTNLTLFPTDTNVPNVTLLSQPPLTGHAQAGLLVQVYDQNQRLIASAVAGPDGTFTARASSPLAVGTYTFKAVAIDSFSNYGANSLPYTLNVVARPLAPTSLSIYPADDTGTKGDGITAVHQPRLSGRAQAGLLVQIYQNQTLVASTTAGPDGSFVATPFAAFLPGTYSFQAVAIGAFGFYGPNSTPLAVTITPPPSAPTNLALFPGDQTGGPGTTTIAKPRLTGKAQAGMMIQIYDQNQRLIAWATAGADGTFVSSPTTALTKGKYTLMAVAIDAGNNYGANGLGYSLNIV